MNYKIYYHFILFFCFSFVNAQQQKLDSIFIKATLDESKNEITVTQEFQFSTQKDTLYFNAWINAYNNKKTPLVNSKIEEQKGDLYFAKLNERGSVLNLKFYTEENKNINYSLKENEFIILDNSKNNKKNTIRAEYVLKIPNSSFTEYGVDKEKNYFLKYFFIQPTFNKNNQYIFQHFLDMETEQTLPFFYQIELKNINNKYIATNLAVKNNILSGVTNQNLEINLLNKKPLGFDVDNHEIIFTFPYKETNYTKKILEEQLDFLKINISELTNKKLIINNKIKKNNFFFGVDDIEITNRLKLQNFSDQEKEALKLFNLISDVYVDKLINCNKSKDHWIKNGLKTYLLINYIESGFPKQLMLAGTLPERSILGFKPLKLFYLSKLPLIERFNIMYLFLSRFANDQILSTEFEKLNKFNQDYVSGNRTGLLFKSIENYLPKDEFKAILTSFVKENKEKNISDTDLFFHLEKNATKPMQWFKESFIKNDFNIDFRLKRIRKEKDSLVVLIKNKTKYTGPFKISGYNKNEVIYSKWIEKTINKKPIEVKIPSKSVNNVVLNLDSYLPEHFDEDNYKNVGGLFNNSKKLFLTPIRSVENPKFNTLIISPNLSFSTQNSVLASVSISNSSFFPKKYTFGFRPSYSFGTSTFLYSVSGGFFEKWKTGIIEKLFLNAGYSVFNSSINSRANSFGAGTSFIFRRNNPRLPISSQVYLNFQSINRELPLLPTLSDFDYKAYQLKEIGYNYSNNGFLNDFSGGIALESSNLFNKINLESYYRIKLTKKNKINFRLFAGLFLNNNSLSNSFDYGISRVNDYKFRNKIIDRSNNQIPLNQQYILGDAGFKSFINTRANQWVISNNTHFNLSSRIGIFTDFGFYKNAYREPKFIYDTGVSLTAVEDFLELYFPIQSSLGFEPSLSNYQQRIRFIFTFNLGTILNYFRRGKY